MNLTGTFIKPFQPQTPNSCDSQDTFIDPRKILGKDKLHERRLPQGMNFHEEGRYNLDKNKYFTGYKNKWDNEMFYVVQEYQQQIFPQTMNNNQIVESATVTLPKQVP